jgi:hypothetical protein
MFKMFADRRAYPRFRAKDHPGLIDYTPVRVLDLSFCGALIETDAWLVVGCRHTLRIEPGIQLDATVVRCSIHRSDVRGKRSRVVRHVGVLFDPPDDLVRRQLLLLLRALGRAASQSPPVELAIAL